MICGLWCNALTVKDHVGEAATMSGVIYSVQTPMADCDEVPATPIRLYVYHHMHERGQQLYAFETLDARQLFEEIISVDNMGCGKAIKMLSSMNPEKVMIHIAEGDVSALSEADGIGKKSAEKIIETLKPRFEKYATTKSAGIFSSFNMIATPGGGGMLHNPDFMAKMKESIELATLGLIKLGYGRRHVKALFESKTWDFNACMPELSPMDLGGINFDSLISNIITRALPRLNSGDC